MFTGLVVERGRLISDPVPSGQGGVRMAVGMSPGLAERLGIGDSVAVSGVCLTVTERGEDRVTVELSPETLDRTHLGDLRGGDEVNLEPALRMGDALGGHMVQGHVDATGRVLAIRADGESHWIDVGFPPELAPMFVPKGSVAMNGVSLTVAALDDARFSVMIIPFTWDHTNLCDLTAGAQVNLECDMVGKYVARAAQWYRR